MKKIRFWLYIPIETKVRDLYGKTLLASQAAADGFDVVIGSKTSINSKSPFLPRGIVFNVGLAKNLAKNSARFKREGHKVAVVDEEGLVTLRDDIYLHQRVSKEGLENADMFFCWGEKQASVVQKKSKETSCQLTITGNPRFDMLRPEYNVIFKKEADKIEKKYKPFILINTNFGRGNHFAGEKFLLNSLEEKRWMDNADDKQYILDNVEWQKNMFQEFQKMVPVIAEKFKNYKIIIRPHPSENHDSWKKIAANFSNVEVIYSGNVIPWIMASQALIHNGCTTAVEAFILGKEAISYRPFIISKQETELPNRISIEADNLQELILNIEEVVSSPDKIDFSARQKYLAHFLSGIEGKTASERMVEKLKSISQPNQKKINIPLLFFFNLLEFIYLKIKNINSRSKQDKILAMYLKHKNPGLKKKDFQGAIQDLSKINKKFLNLKIKKIIGDCFWIYNDK